MCSLITCTKLTVLLRRCNRTFKNDIPISQENDPVASCNRNILSFLPEWAQVHL
uniref:Uncharacterized protein n=1 Tax=Arundo donax TaxID=35708 RepID=A0A0A9GVI9_ARUDO